MSITKSPGQTPTERFLAELCDRTFLKLWAYPNPYKADGKELCDLLVAFEDRVFIFFDRATYKFEDTTKDIDIQWKRWKKEAVDKQIATALGARDYILANPRGVFLDAKGEVPLPIPIDPDTKKIHKVIVAHGAEQACKAASPDNVFGSLAISYSGLEEVPLPFFLSLDRDDIVHVLDSFNLPILLQERDTIYDFSTYMEEKEASIRRHFLSYCGEEDLLAHYMSNYNPNENRYRIGDWKENQEISGLHIGEGEWQSFSKSESYKRRKAADEISYAWDRLIQRTAQNALDGNLLGDGNVFSRPSAILEMAKEPRFSRRNLAELMRQVIINFPADKGPNARNVSLFPSFHEGKAFVFLQFRTSDDIRGRSNFRQVRQEMLRIACGAAKNMMPELTCIVGIGLDAPKFHREVGEDFLLMKCDTWSESQRQEIEQANAELQFFKTRHLMRHSKSSAEFPPPP